MFIINKHFLLFIIIASVFAFKNEAYCQSKADILLVNKWQHESEEYCSICFDSVLSSSLKIIRLAQDNNWLQKQLDAIINICVCGALHNRLSETSKFVMNGMKLLVEKSDEIEEFDTLSYYKAFIILNYGTYLFGQGNYEKAIEQLSKILSLSGVAMTSDKDLLFSSCNYLGQSYFNLGNFDIALQYFQFGLEIRQLNKSDYKIKALQLMYDGEYLFAIEQIEKAISRFHEALNILENNESPESRNTLRANYLLISKYYDKNQEYDSAIIFSRKAISLYNDNYQLVSSYTFLGDVFFKKKFLDSALVNYRISLSIADLIYDSIYFNKWGALKGIANVYREKKDFRKASEYYSQALRNLSIKSYFDDNYLHTLLPLETMQVLIEQAEMYLDWANLNNEIKYIDTCISILNHALKVNDTGRRELFTIENKESKAELQSKITSIGINASFKAYKLSNKSDYLWNAFVFMEKSKANILRDKVDEVHAKSYSGIPKSIINTELSLKGELHLLEDEIHNAKSSTQLKTMQSAYNKKFREYISFSKNLEQQYPRYFRLKYNVDIPNTSEIRRQLSNKTLLILYNTSDEKIYSLSITRKKITGFIFQYDNTLKNHLKKLLYQISNPEIAEVVNDPKILSEYCAASEYIYKAILEPVISKSHGINKLVIVPDGQLCYLPYEILLTEKKNSRISDLSYVFRKYQIRYDYSVSLLLENKFEKQKAKYDYLGFAPGYYLASDQPGSSKYSELTGSKEEIKACRKIWNGKSFSGSLATSTEFLKNSANANIIHLGVHAYVNDKDPQSSCILFSPNKSEKGLIYLSELYNLDINAHLAILSGCETGIGNFRKGEGIISLARAFKYAGCQSIIMSLWKVNDLATKDIMIEFNRNLKKGMSKGRALQKAKLYFIKSSNNPHPAFWSSFVLIGNDEPVKRNNTLYYLIPAVVVTVIFFIKRKKIL